MNQIDGVTLSGIPYRRGGSAFTGGLTVAWDVLPDCPTCAKLTGERCVIEFSSGRFGRKITPHRERCAGLKNSVMNTSLYEDIT